MRLFEGIVYIGIHMQRVRVHADSSGMALQMLRAQYGKCTGVSEIR